MGAGSRHACGCLVPVVHHHHDRDHYHQWTKMQASVRRHEVSEEGLAALRAVPGVQDALEAVPEEQELKSQD